MSVAVDRKSDQNRAVAGRERHRLGEGLVEAGSYKRKGCGGDRSAQKTTSIDRLWFIAAFGRHGRLHCLKTVRQPARARSRAHIAQERSPQCRPIRGCSRDSRGARSRACDPWSVDRACWLARLPWLAHRGDLRLLAKPAGKAILAKQGLPRR